LYQHRVSLASVAGGYFKTAELRPLSWKMLDHAVRKCPYQHATQASALAKQFSIHDTRLRLVVVAGCTEQQLKFSTRQNFDISRVSTNEKRPLD